MDSNQLRNLIAPMTRGSKKIIPHVTMDIEIEFSERGLFNATFTPVGNKRASSSSTGYTSLKTFVETLMYNFIPKEGEVYQHINGNIYTVLHIANKHSTREDYPVSVVYQGPNNNVWVKPMTNFMRKMSRIK